MSVCNGVADNCACSEPAGHSSPHKCECGGSWRGTLWESDFRLVAPPLIPAKGSVIIDCRR